MRARRLTLLVLVLALGPTSTLGAACATSPSPDAPAEVTPPPLLGGGPAPVDPYDPDAALGLRTRALFASCAGGPESECHGSGAGGLTLRLGPAGDVVNVASSERPDLLRVRPFDASRSYLFLKVLGDGGIEGGRMPPGGTDPRAVDLLGAWIEAGAPVP
jgi:hypothetical protein